MAKIDNGAGEFAELTADAAGKTIAGAKIDRHAATTSS